MRKKTLKIQVQECSKEYGSELMLQRWFLVACLGFGASHTGKGTSSFQLDCIVSTAEGRELTINTTKWGQMSVEIWAQGVRSRHYI